MKRILYVILFFVAITATAQNHEPELSSLPADTTQKDTATISLYSVISQIYRNKLDALRKDFGKWCYAGSDTLTNPYYFRLFSSQTRYDSPLRRTIGSLTTPEPTGATLVSGKVSRIDKFIAEQLSDVYANQPSLRSDGEEACDANGLRHDVNKEIIVDASSITLGEESRLSNENVGLNLSDDPFKVVVTRPNFWKYSANFSLQFMQYYVTDNWYKGGESNNSLLATFIADANFDNKRNITFENKLEMKLGFQSTKSSQNTYKTNADLLRLTNKFGLKAAKNWSYTAMLQSWTQFYKTFDGSGNVRSDFMSPFESIFSLGMEYKLTKSKFNIKAVLSPAALNIKYVDRTNLTATHGLEDKHCKVDVGSTATINTTWNICKQVKWDSRLYMFTNYEKLQVDWENTVTLSINKFLSTKVFLNPRFDDGVTRNGDSNFEFNEWISVGFECKF